MSFVVGLIVLAAWASWVYIDRPATARGAIAVLIAAVAALAAWDGITLAVREYERMHDGVVTSGIVIGKLSSIGVDGSAAIRPPRSRRTGWLLMPAPGFGIHDEAARVILTGSLNVWVVDYRYGCLRPQGCRGRDFVPEALWRQLSIGQTISVRRSHNETSSSRLDGNPRWDVAMVTLAFAATLFGIAGVVSGRLTTTRKRGYLTAPAVVTAVERVNYRDVVRWRVRFAYFDQNGDPQQGSDEVVCDVWKPGDECIAVFPPSQPALASFRPTAPSLPAQSAAAR